MNEKVNNKTWMFYSILFLFILIQCLIVRNYFDIQFLSGDDAIEYQIYSSMNHIEYIFNFTNNHFRPISNLFLLLEWKLCGPDPANISLFNSLFFSIIILSSIRLFLKKENIVAFLITPLICFSRFNWYLYMSILGTMEMVCVIFVLLIVYYMIKYLKNKRNLYLAFINLFYLLLIFSHERFIIMIVPIILFLLLNIKNNISNKFIIALCLPLISVISLFIIKVVIFKGEFLTDTAGKSFDITFINLIKNGFNTILNLFNYPIGEDYFQGILFEQLSNLYKILIIINSIILFTSLIIWVYNVILKIKSKNYKNIIDVNFILLLTLLILLAPAIVSYRLELRWLIISYILLLIFAYYQYNSIKLNKALKVTSNIILVTYFIILFPVNKHMLKNSEPYFYLVQNRDNSIYYYESTILPNLTDLNNKKIIIINNDNEDHYNLYAFYHQFQQYDIDVYTDEEYIKKPVDTTILKDSIVYQKWNGNFKKLLIDNTKMEYSDFWIGKNYETSIFTSDGYVSLTTYFSPDLPPNGMTIKINGEIVEYVNPNELQVFSYYNEKYINKLLLVEIIMDSTYNPSEHGGEDVRELGIILSSIISGNNTHS